jgi:hypothetical protein
MLRATMVSGQLEAGELLGASLPHLVPERVVEAASALTGCPVAAYVLDLDGSFALRLAGDVERFPERIRAPVGVGPEIIAEVMPQLRELVIDRIGPSTVWPLVVRDRVMGFLLARAQPAVDLEPFAAQAALALELASGYTDALHAVRRRKDTQPAAEIQQNLLPPRLASVDRADVAVLSAEVGPGDRLLLYSDGVSERRTADGGRIGESGMRAVLAELGTRSAAMTVRRLQDAVIAASREPLRDDATLLVIAPHD